MCVVDDTLVALKRIKLWREFIVRIYGVLLEGLEGYGTHGAKTERLVARFIATSVCFFVLVG